jgi:type I restriction enzyme R subunit
LSLARCQGGDDQCRSGFAKGPACHLGNPIFVALGERLEKIKLRHEEGFLNSLQFLKEILELAAEVLESEKQVDPGEERDRAKEALTELFNEAKSNNTHIIIERIVADIDEIVRTVRFPDLAAN